MDVLIPDKKLGRELFHCNSLLFIPLDLVEVLLIYSIRIYINFSNENIRWKSSGPVLFCYQQVQSEDQALFYSAKLKCLANNRL